MENKNFLFTLNKGKKNALDVAYNNLINSIIETLDEEKEDRWETYNTIFQELADDDKVHYFEEIKYRLTDGENPNSVILNIIDREADSVSELVWFLKRRVEEYLDEDYFKRFYE